MEERAIAIQGQSPELDPPKDPAPKAAVGRLHLPGPGAMELMGPWGVSEAMGLLSTVWAALIGAELALEFESQDLLVVPSIKPCRSRMVASMMWLPSFRVHTLPVQGLIGEEGA